MKIINIDIEKEKILQDISLNSAYAGAKSPGEKDIFERVATVNEDSGILSGFFSEMCGSILEKFSGNVASSSLTESRFSLVLEVSGSFDESLSESLVNDITAYMSAGVTARWFQITLAEKAVEWDAKANLLLQRAFAKICQRKRPQRPQTIS